MLKFLRKKKTVKRIFWVAALLIIPSFITWRAGNLSKKGKLNNRVSIGNNIQISSKDFVKSLKDAEVGLFLNYFNQPEVLDKLKTDRQLLNQLAYQNLILKNITKREKIAVSDREVVKFISTHPLFNKRGEFNNKLYEHILKYNLGLMPRDFEESVRSFLANSKLKEDITKNVAVSEEELLWFYKNEYEKVKFSYISIDKNRLKDEIVVSENEINSFYDRNKIVFKKEEEVVLQYISFPHEDSKEKALANLEATYEKLKHHPQDIENIARNLGLTIKETPPFSQNETVPEINTVKDMGIIAFGLKPRQDILPIIDEKETGISYIIRVKEKNPPHIKSKEKVSSYIANLIKNEKSIEFANKKAATLYNELKVDDISLEELAKRHNLKLHNTEFISRYDNIDEIGEAYKIVEMAFKLKPGQVSNPIEIRNGFAIIEPIEFKFINEDEFKKEKENYKNKALSIKKMRIFDNWLKSIAINYSFDVDPEEF